MTSLPFSKSQLFGDNFGLPELQLLVPTTLSSSPLRALSIQVIGRPWSIADHQNSLNLTVATGKPIPGQSPSIAIQIIVAMANSPPSAPPFLVIATVYRAEIHFGTLQAIGLDRLGCLNMVTNYPNRPELFIRPTILSWFILNSTISTLFHTVFQRFVV